jgi:hypothetical protein
MIINVFLIFSCLEGMESSPGEGVENPTKDMPKNAQIW